MKFSGSFQEQDNLHSSSWLISAWHAAVAKTRVLIEIVESYLVMPGCKNPDSFLYKEYKVHLWWI